MQYKKPLLVAGAVATVGLAGFGGLGRASAATTSNTDASGGSSIIDKLASTFNLDRSKVQAVFDEERSQHEAERKQAVTDKLAQAVTDGKITEVQKQAILDKMSELQAKRQSNKDSFTGMTNDERRAAMKQERTDLKAWATDNNIPQEYLRYVFGGGMGRGPGGPGGFGMHRDVRRDVQGDVQGDMNAQDSQTTKDTSSET